VRENEELIDVMSKYKGQGVLNFLDLDDVTKEVDSAIVDLFPETEKPGRVARAANS
jgi:hypothetical protein